MRVVEEAELAERDVGAELGLGVLPRPALLEVKVVVHRHLGRQRRVATGDAA